MFGYVTTNMEEMKIKDYRIYHGFYCGVCQDLKEDQYEQNQQGKDRTSHKEGYEQKSEQQIHQKSSQFIYSSVPALHKSI